jgi:hypothetical protein
MSILSSRELIAVTQEFADLCFDHVERKLGMSAIAMARDQDEIALTTLLGLADNEYDAWKTYMQNVEEDNSTTSEQVMDAELEFIEQVLQAVGRVNEYSITNVLSGRIEIMRTVQSDEADLTHLTIIAQLQTDGSVDLQKRKDAITLSPRKASSEILPISNEDYETFEQLFHGLVEATHAAKNAT